MPKPVRQQQIAYAVYVTLSCTIVIASLAASPGGSGIFGGALGLLMLAVAVIDKRSFIIPDRLTLAAFLLGLANTANESFGSIGEDIIIATMRGGLIALAFYIYFGRSIIVCATAMGLVLAT